MPGTTEKDSKRILSSMFEDYAGCAPGKVELLTSSGSHRKYYRITGAGKTVIGVAGTDPEENRAFCRLAVHFASKGINVPAVYAVSGDSMHYIQEDLGHESLFDCISQGRLSGHYSDREVSLLKTTIRELPKIQYAGAEGLDFGRCYPVESFDRTSVMFDLHYFKYCFLKGSGVEFNEFFLEKDFSSLADALLVEEDNTFMYRDFQSRNILVRDGVPYFIDFQDGRRGPVYYDIASFVWQARSAFSPELRRELVDEYLSAMRPYRQVDAALFHDRLRLFVLFRTLQVLGAYGFRGYFERKRHFLESIPYAISNLKELMSQPFDSCGYLCKVLSSMAELPRFSSVERPGQGFDASALEVEICSFSYRKGIPQDMSGNGGGYVFDCRAIHNPGKYEQYKGLTGMDREVQEFLERTGEVQPFLDSVYSMVDAHVERYVRRGFTHLMVCFGCTGGQHRSVYCAEALAAHVSGKYGVRVVLRHREQGIEKEF